MKVRQTAIPDVVILEPRVFGDDRGFFFESYSEQALLTETSIRDRFIQDNHSRSMKNVLRGLHYQIQHPQGKLVRAVVGEILDVAVDIRRSSAYFGQWVGVRLSAANKQQLWVPPGFAHGFVVLSDFAEVLYKTTDVYAPQHERCILWNDPDLAIDWQFEGEPILSAKDQLGKLLSEAEVFDETYFGDRSERTSRVGTAAIAGDVGDSDSDVSATNGSRVVDGFIQSR